MRIGIRSLVCGSVLLAACATSGAEWKRSGAKTNADFITTAEIDAATFRDAYDIVQRLRPNWFTKARASSGGGLSGTQVSGSSAVQSGGNVGLVVYLDNAKMGRDRGASRHVREQHRHTPVYGRSDRDSEAARNRIEHRERRDRGNLPDRALTTPVLPRGRRIAANAIARPRQAW